MQVRHTIFYVAAAVIASGCAAGTPAPGDAGYAYNVEGLYRGRLLVDGSLFEVTLDVRTNRGGRVRGSFDVSAPLEIDGTVTGTVVDDLLRVTLTYENEDSGRACEGRIEGILSVQPGGMSVDGPVTIADCGDSIPGRLSFRR